MPQLQSTLVAAVLGAALALPLAPALTKPAVAQGAFVEEVASVSALVHDIDLTTRQVLLETGEQEFVTITAPEEVRNLPQVEVGDTVTLAFYGGIAASLAPVGEPPIATDITEALVRAEEGRRPAGASLRELTTTVTFDAWDPETNIVTFTGQAGIQREMEVLDEEMQDFVATLEAGDQVDVTIVEIIALVVD